MTLHIDASVNKLCSTIQRLRPLQANFDSRLETRLRYLPLVFLYERLRRIFGAASPRGPRRGPLAPPSRSSGRRRGARRLCRAGGGFFVPRAPASPA